jgi:hypothetical protein
MSQRYHIALFFTFGTNLEKWVDRGILEREVKPYLKLAEQGHKVTFITWGDQRDTEIGKNLPSISVIPAGKVGRNLKGFIKSILLPFQLRSKIKPLLQRRNPDYCF